MHLLSVFIKLFFLAKKMNIINFKKIKLLLISLIILSSFNSLAYVENADGSISGTNQDVAGMVRYICDVFYGTVASNATACNGSEVGKDFDLNSISGEVHFTDGDYLKTPSSGRLWHCHHGSSLVCWDRRFNQFFSVTTITSCSGNSDCQKLATKFCASASASSLSSFYYQSDTSFNFVCASPEDPKKCEAKKGDIVSISPTPGQIVLSLPVCSNGCVVESVSSSSVSTCTGLDTDNPTCLPIDYKYTGEVCPSTGTDIGTGTGTGTDTGTGTGTDSCDSNDLFGGCFVFPDLGNNCDSTDPIGGCYMPPENMKPKPEPEPLTPPPPTPPPPPTTDPTESNGNGQCSPTSNLANGSMCVCHMSDDATQNKILCELTVQHLDNNKLLTEVTNQSKEATQQAKDINNKLDLTNNKLDIANSKIDNTNNKLDGINSNTDALNKNTIAGNNKLDSINSNTDALNKNTIAGNNKLDKLDSLLKEINDKTCDPRTDPDHCQKKDPQGKDKVSSSIDGLNSMMKGNMDKIGAVLDDVTKQIVDNPVITSEQLNQSKDDLLGSTYGIGQVFKHQKCAAIISKFRLHLPANFTQMSIAEYTFSLPCDSVDKFKEMFAFFLWLITVWAVWRLVYRSLVIRF